MKKISLILAISASFIVGTLVAGNLVFAAPADSQNELLSAILQQVEALNLQIQTSEERNIELLVPMAGKKLQASDTQGSSFLFYGDILCGINLFHDTSDRDRTIYVEFAATTTVEHDASAQDCNGIDNPNQIHLEGGADLVFQSGDFIFFGEANGWNELYKEQTIP